MRWYKGFASVENGSTGVVFASAAVADAVRAGDMLIAADDRAYEVVSISGANVTIDPAYLGATASAAEVRVVQTQVRNVEVAAALSQLVATYGNIALKAGAGKFDPGSALAPALANYLDQDTGLFFDENGIGFAVAGAEVARVGATGFTGNLTGNTAGTHTGDVDGNATTATALADPFTLTVSGGASGYVSLDGSGDVLLDLALESLPALSASIADASAVVASVIFSLSDMADGGDAIRNAKHASWHKELGPMPEKVGVYATATDVVIRDLTKPNAPVWMTFQGSGGANMAGGSASSGYVTCVAMRGGKLVIGQAQGTSFGNGIVVIDFAKDEAVRYRSVAGASFAGRYLGGIGQANDGLGWDGSSAQGIIGGVAIKDVSAYVHSDAPCDPVTGLPVVTIAVGHSSGADVIRHDGTIQAVGYAYQTGYVSFDQEGGLWLGSTSVSNLQYAVPPFASVAYLATAYKTGSNLMLSQKSSWSGVSQTVGLGGAAASMATGASEIAIVAAAGTHVMQLGSSFADTQFSGLVGSWLNSNDDADLTGGELVTNGDFSGGLTGWDAGAGVTASGGAAACSGAATILTQSMGLVSGKSYVLTLSYTETSSLRLRVEGSPSGGVLATSGSISGTGSGTLTFNFVAASSGVKIAADGATFTGTIDNVSVRIADPDRSVSNKGLAVYGTVQKSEAVAGSGGLMGYSGFSASNRLEQPYSSALDFGTGDFTVSAMVYGADSLSTATIMSRATSSSTGWHLYKETTSSTGALKFRMASWTLSGTTKLGAAWYHVVVRRIGSTVSLFVNDRLEATYTQAADVSSAAPLQVGWSTVTPMVSGLPAISQAQVYARGLSNDEISLLHRLQRAALHGKATLRSGDIKSIAADPYSGDLHVLTAVGRQVFDGKTLQETGFEAITGKTKLAVHNGDVSVS